MQEIIRYLLRPRGPQARTAIIVGTSILTALAICAALFVSRRRITKKSLPQNILPLPPGPKPLPVFGNLLDVPNKREWETITKWKYRYGDIVHIRILGRSIVYVNTAEAAIDLFSKRSTIYSDRPRLPLLNEMMGMEWNFGFMQYGEKWRRYRKVFNSKFGSTIVRGYNNIQEESTLRLLGRLRDSPERFLDHLHLHVAQTIIKATYGIDVDSSKDRYVVVAQAVMDAVSKAATPGAWLVDCVPFLKHIPAWVPFASVQRVARTWRRNCDDLLWGPYNAVKAGLAAGEGRTLTSFVHDQLENRAAGVDDADWEQVVRECAAVAYGAGSDTVLCSLKAFVLAMVLNSGVQVKAQEDLDSFLGSTRLPMLSDHDDLPYISAIVKELLRWHVVAPQGIPHCLTVDDEYNGHRIPAGAIVVSNTWGILHDPSIYVDPDEFRPERFIVNGAFDCASNDPAKFAFGNGRRICPGMSFAENMLWITIARLLATFSFGHVLDEEGKPIKVSLSPTSGMLSSPAPFKCSITPRL